MVQCLRYFGSAPSVPDSRYKVNRPHWRQPQRRQVVHHRAKYRHHLRMPHYAEAAFGAYLSLALWADGLPYTHGKIYFRRTIPSDHQWG